jgi:hypothetical protein
MIIMALLLQAAAVDVSKRPGQPAGIDISQMPIEDAVAMMFMMISEDAREDTRAMLAEMEQARLKRSALREAEQEMTRELIRLKAFSKLSGKTNSDGLFQRQIMWANELPSICGKLTGAELERCLEKQVRRRTSQLRNLPSGK